MQYSGKIFVERKHFDTRPEHTRLTKIYENCYVVKHDQINLEKIVGYDRKKEFVGGIEAIPMLL